MKSKGFSTAKTNKKKQKFGANQVTLFLLFYCLGNKLREVIEPARVIQLMMALDKDPGPLTPCPVLLGCSKDPGKHFSRKDCENPREMKMFLFYF